MNQYVQPFFDYLAASPTAFHAVEGAKRQLLKAGYVCLNEHEAYKLQAGGRYFVTRNQSALIAFQVPGRGLAPFRITASHVDSPALKLKAVMEDRAVKPYVRLNAEKYGGAILSTWLDRPLSVAGRLLVRTEGGIQSRLCDLGRDAAVIPNLAIHFNRNVNDGYSFNVQKDMMALWGDGAEENALLAELADGVGADVKDVVGHDLFLYSRTPGTVWGAKNEFLSAGRLDDLECAWTCLQAFLAAQGEDHLNVYALFDNEEVGSLSKQGADSTLLADTLLRIGEALGAGAGETRAAMAAGFMASADNAQAFHPNYPEKYDAQNRVLMNGGVVVKYSANQKYTTDGVSSALFSEVCRAAGVPVQYFVNRSDIVGGATLGGLSNTHVSMNTVDIGLAQLAMHSVWETAGVQDLPYMIDALKMFYRAGLRMKGDGTWETEFPQ